jgi:FkbM family methyltransferase
MKIKGFAEYNKRADYGCQMEILVSLIYHALVRQNEVVIEGGANGGLHAVPLARLISPSGRLICFEPLPTVHAQLKQYIASERLLNVTELHCSALGESEGKIEFVEVHDNCALSHIKSDVEDTKERTDVIEVILETIDTTFLLQQLNFIKLDLEGYDFIALKGGERTLRKFRPPIIFENGREWHAKKYHYTKEDFFQFFDDIEYEVFDIHNTFLNRDNWESP